MRSTARPLNLTSSSANVDIAVEDKYLSHFSHWLHAGNPVGVTSPLPRGQLVPHLALFFSPSLTPPQLIFCGIRHHLPRFFWSITQSRQLISLSHGTAVSSRLRLPLYRESPVLRFRSLPPSGPWKSKGNHRQPVAAPAPHTRGSYTKLPDTNLPISGFRHHVSS